jgi:hypothetical protein
MRSVEQREIERAIKGIGRDGSALDEAYRFGPEIGMIAQTGDGAVEAFDGESAED